VTVALYNDNQSVKYELAARETSDVATIGEGIVKERHNETELIANINTDYEYIKYFSDLGIKPIIIDSGTTNTTFTDIILFDSLEKNLNSKYTVSMGTFENTSIIDGIGNSSLFPDVNYVKNLFYSLISLGRITSHPLNWNHRGTGREWIFTDQNGNVVLEANCYSNHVYYLSEYHTKKLVFSSVYKHIYDNIYRFNEDTYQYESTSLEDSSPMILAVTASPDSKQLEFDRNKKMAHILLGHMSNGKMVMGARKNLFPGLRFSNESLIKGQLPLCYDCMRGRMQRIPRGSVTQHNWEKFNKISCDWVPMKTKSIQKQSGFFLFVDYLTGYVFIFLSMSKESASLIIALKQVRTLARLHNHTIKIFQSDNESIFKADIILTWLEDESITYQHSSAYRHSQNGDIESIVKSIDSKHLQIMSTYDCPNRFWNFAFKHAVYLHNRYPNSNNPDSISPHEAITGIRPDFSNFVTFYAAGVYLLTKEERIIVNDSYKARPCHYLGVPDESPINSVIYDITSKSIITRFDTKFPKELEWKNFEKFEVTDDQPPYAPITKDDIIDIRDNTSHSIKTFDNQQNEYFQQEVNPDYPSTNEEELSEQAINSMTCPSDDIDKWFGCFICAAMALSLPPTPKSVSEALHPSNPWRLVWWDAIYKELSNIDEAGVFGDCPPNGRGMKTKVAFRVSYDNDLKLKFKARLVACGYSQIHGIDYHDTYAPTIPILIVSILLHISGHFNYYNAIFDVTAAFLEALNDVEQFCYLPQGLFDKDMQTRKAVLKALYGEKQAPKMWYLLINSILVEKMGYSRCPFNACLYLKWDSKQKQLMIISIHVDDGFMVFNTPGMDQTFITELNKYIRKATLSSGIKKYLGMELEKIGRHYHIHHTTYINDIDLLEINSSSPPSDYPMNSKINLKICIKNDKNESLLPVTGKLRYIADRARCDILTSVGKIASDGLPHPSDEHVDSAKQILRYLKSNPDLTTKLGGVSDICLFAFSDANFEKTGNCHSRLGGCIFMGLDSGAIYNYSCNDSLVAHSSAESEIRAADKIIRTIIFVKDVLTWIGLVVSQAVTIYVDNEAMIDIATTMKASDNLKHINICINYIREKVNDGTVFSPLLFLSISV
jgi:hypothetical protein